MEHFTRLYYALDETTKTNEKLAVLDQYFRVAPPRDAAWALFFLMGARIQRAVPTPLLRVWIAEDQQIPLWLVEESYHAVGDLAETLALLHRDATEGLDEPLYEVVESRLIPLRGMSDDERRRSVLETWKAMDRRQRFVWNKLLLGEFRVGVAKTLVIRAVATVADVEPAVMAHRLMGTWEPTEHDYLRLLGEADGFQDVSRPYPFYLAYPLEVAPGTLGNERDWQAEWKWDGIRAQLIRRMGNVLIWTRGEELVSTRWPEITEAAEQLPDGTVMDGEILAWGGERPLPFGALQRRIGRKVVSAKLCAEVPVVFMAYDLLEAGGKDVRKSPMSERRETLEAVVQRASDPHIQLSPKLVFGSWDELARKRGRSREENVEGIMLKRLSSAYGVGRVKGDWWKWKINPYTVDAVLIYAQSGHGRRASLFTDYTFGVWHEGQLVPVAKAYSGLTDAEIREVDQFIRRNTVERFGPVRVVKPELVFEIAFEGIQPSTRHKSGLAVRFPRMARWRQDKKPEDADTLEMMRGLIRAA